MNTSSRYMPHQQPNFVQWFIVLMLLVIMIVTRGGFVPQLQDASWAVFFLVGFYFRSYIGLPLIILAAVIIDFAMIAARGGHQDYYLSPSYLFIIPAYGALWLTGRYFAKNYSEDFKGLITFLSTAVLGVIACDLISSGGFYWASAPEVEISVAEFINRFMEFLPLYLKSTLFYLSIVAMIHLAILQTRKLSNSQQTKNS